MPFWGSKTLRERLPQLVEPYRVAQHDIASFRLSIGEEVYVSPTGEHHDPLNKPKMRLVERQSFVIPAGQFGFIQTREIIHVPEDAIAFISIRASVKFRGLVNVSGFHVDPGYKGRLIFAVFNAGPGAVHLQEGDQCFLIWYADLDGIEDVLEKKDAKTIPGELTERIGAGVQSFAGLDAKIDKKHSAHEERIVKLERESAVRQAIFAILIALMFLMLGIVVRDAFAGSESSREARPAASVPAAGEKAP